MNKVSRVVFFVCACASLLLSSGCLSRRVAPLTYVALARPSGPIQPAGEPVKLTFTRRGFYFLNAGFRPAPDVGDYIRLAQKKSGCEILKNADIEFCVPWGPVTDLGIAGYYNIGKDGIRANQKERKSRDNRCAPSAPPDGAKGTE